MRFRVNYRAVADGNDRLPRKSGLLIMSRLQRYNVHDVLDLLVSDDNEDVGNDSYGHSSDFENDNDIDSANQNSDDQEEPLPWVTRVRRAFPPLSEIVFR